MVQRRHLSSSLYFAEEFPERARPEKKEKRFVSAAAEVEMLIEYVSLSL